MNVGIPPFRSVRFWTVCPEPLDVLVSYLLRAALTYSQHQLNRLRRHVPPDEER